MKLYITPGSPYARITRIMVIEKQLINRIEIKVAQTRTESSPYYAINPSGRVPFLLRDDGVGMEDSALICRYLDHLGGNPVFDLPTGEPGWEAARLSARATSLMDGLSVWLREERRPPAEQSPGIIQHERDRAARMIDLWEHEITHAWMTGPYNITQMILSCAFGLEARLGDFRWRDGHPRLNAWFDQMARRPSFAATAPTA